MMSSSLRLFTNSTLRLDKRILFVRYSSSETKNDSIDITSVEEIPKYVESIDETNEAVIMMKRNKSQLNDSDRNIIHGLAPFSESIAWHHDTIRYKKRLLGRYGVKGLGNVNIGALWPTQEEIDDKKEYEKVLNPKTLQENWELIAQQNHKKAESIRLRDEEIVNKMAQVEKWKKEYYAKLAKKEADLIAAKEKRERLIEDVRRQFGFKIDPKDNRFKEALELKEKEDQKRLKEAKKKERASRFMARLLAQNTGQKSEEVQTKTTEEKKE